MTRECGSEARKARKVEGKLPLTLWFDDPEAAAAAAPEAAERLRKLGRRLEQGVRDLICEGPPEAWEDAAQPVIREAQAAYRRGGWEAARLAISRHRLAPARQVARAPRSASVRRRGSRRTSSSSRTSGTDPGDPDGEPRSCACCDKPLIGKAPQARYCDDACRMRARRRADKPTRPRWNDAAVFAAAASFEPTAALAALMADPPHGALTAAVVA